MDVGLGVNLSLANSPYVGLWLNAVTIIRMKEDTFIFYL